MNFRPELAAKVMAGQKTVTRRIAQDSPTSHWSKSGCFYKPGRGYAVCPGRGKNGIGRILVNDVRLEPVGHLSLLEARREGFADPFEFEAVFTAINGSYDPDALVWRVSFTTGQEAT